MQYDLIYLFGIANFKMILDKQVTVIPIHSNKSLSHLTQNRFLL